MATPSREPGAPTPAELLHAAQDFEPASSFQVRDGLIEYLSRDLLGPWGGETEQLSDYTPRDRYLVGQLGPKTLSKQTSRDRDDPANDPSELDDGSAPIASTEDTELAEQTPPVDTGRMWASSMGVSFKLAPETDTIHVTASWGRYRKVGQTDEEGAAKRVWQREPVEYAREIRIPTRSERIPLTGASAEEPCVVLHVEAKPKGEGTSVVVSLVNGQRTLETNGDEAWLFQPRLQIRALDGASPVFLPLDDPESDDIPPSWVADAEDMRLRLLYRNRLQYARGRNVAVAAEAPEDGRRAHLLRTEWLPVTDVPGTSAPTPAQSPRLAGLELSMAALAEADVPALQAGLAPLAAGYSDWLEEQEARIAGLPEQLRPYAVGAMEDARAVASRIADGVRLLTDERVPAHADALRAFRFAQSAMKEQRVHTQIAARRATTGEDYRTAKAAIEGKGAGAASWRPFQLAFLLLNLASLADPGHPERQATKNGLVDLLFFPTGGGKTEAYLGLAAFTLAMRRLQGVTGTGEDARDAAAGVAVFMRYTLRLLTSQQFQRASALVCAAELLRQAEPEVFGAEPYRIGLWVGMKVTPNSFEGAAEDVAKMKDSGKTAGSGVLQLQACPWCGETFDPNSVEVDIERQRVLVYCPRSNTDEDRCPFSRRSSDEGVPIVSVDEEIYRLLPAFIIATVDKLAQLPWKGEAGMLFGRVRERCPRHGYKHPDLDGKVGCTSQHKATGKLPAVKAVPVVAPRPLDLIIQDELHLISGALGTSVALFESAVDYLLQWPYDDGEDVRSVGPKIVASTATTKRSKAQVRGLYNRRVAIFPPPVIDIEDTFFSKQDEVNERTPGRRYLGLCAHGVRLKQAEIRLWDTLLLIGQSLFDKHGTPADPYMTPVGYFNATRELAGMRRYLDDDVSVRVSRARDGFPKRLIGSETLRIIELTSRIASREIAATLTDLETGFDPESDTTERKRGWRGEFGAAAKERREPDRLAVEYSRRIPRAGAVLATSMLQVGVDVSRFGLMVVTGQPKNTAEYIQASSRVGRDASRPGLVVALYNWTRPRDLDHFEDFHHYHQTFYRQVEALSVTPFTRRSLDRGATGALAAAIRQTDAASSPNPAAAAFDRTSPQVRDVLETFAERAEDIAGPAGGYLRERAEAFFDDWDDERARGNLVYRPGRSQTNRNGLLKSADGSDWTSRTVANSMRETEGEAKLLFPPLDEVYERPRGAAAWAFPVKPGDAKDGA
ncbi:DISARM system helicase DrmA [Glycomyces sp. NPDC021274]|uniref:DISARM system helicase DrmA n=1 Tax=Glycomyces sp. NPDC021274 TaxID=3155120 RepID=UPI0033D306C6